MQKTLIIFLLVALSFFNIFGQKQSSGNSKNKTGTKQKTQSQIPKGWKLIDLDSFSFLLPESMKDKKARGIDSAVWWFEDAEMELHIDSGMYTNDFQNLKESYKVEEEQARIDGKNVKFFTWDENKDISDVYAVNKDGSIKPHDVFEKHFAIGVYFQRGQRR
ncbi:MAG: hypothetical protein H0U50_13005 [Pyrinomonadaceae bacterium]|nr:hypothetical protein [Pyrinomonadaceae bacterium]